MLGDFATRGLLLVFGYAYPAFQCFKTVEKSQVEIEELRFWCRYWIIVAMVTILERIMDILISWSPMYNELKLAFILYLWHPKTKGTAHVYDTMLHPFVAQHENSVKRKLMEWRARAWDLAIFYWQNSAALVQNVLIELLQFLASQSESSNKVENHESYATLFTLLAAIALLPSIICRFSYRPATILIPNPLYRLADQTLQDSSNQKYSSSLSTSMSRAMSETSKPEDVQVHHVEGQTEYACTKEETAPTREPRTI